MLDPRNSFAPAALMVACSGLLLQAGCGDSGAPKRYALSGNVTFNGQPVPAGEIRFSPNSERGNQGPGTFAKIEKGRYSTPPNRGTIGGAMIVKIFGFDGIPYNDRGEIVESGNPLFRPYVVEVDLPQDVAEYDFDVPKPKSRTGR
ncbi:hypothetical protein [Planctomicrobium sp. SH664]|uniref:hypothetical protein n=1 Tax=Planctomicrobium sp. SH664 TaxID=3448125 RepID=UPI003F5C8CCE